MALLIVHRWASAPAPARPGRRAIEAGVETFTTQFGCQADDIDDELHQFVAPDTVVPAYATTMRELLEPTPAMPRLGEALVNKALRPIAEGLMADLRRDGGTASSEGPIPARSAIGRKRKDPVLIADIPRAELARAYGGLSADLREAARRAGCPEVVRARRGLRQGGG